MFCFVLIHYVFEWLEVTVALFRSVESVLRSLVGKAQSAPSAAIEHLTAVGEEIGARSLAPINSFWQLGESIFVTVSTELF